MPGKWPQNKSKKTKECKDWTQDQTKSVYKIGENASYSNAFSRPFVSTMGDEYTLKLGGSMQVGYEVLLGNQFCAEKC